MTRLRIIAISGAAGLAMLTLVAAQQPPALGTASPGDWELSGMPGAKVPIRQCLADLTTLIQLEHRGRHCTRTLIRDQGHSTIVQYDCGPAGFGRTQIDVLTPRSLRISTQGISDSLPFNYVLQARRMGECTKSVSSLRH